MRIAQILFSTNRLEYVTRTLEAQSQLDFGSHTVDKIFFDDYPQGRNTRLLRLLAETYGYRECIFHDENQGLSRTWTECFDLIRSRNYDYIWHQEDDVVITQPVKIDALIALLESDPLMTQVVLKRQPWYTWDDPTLLKDTDRLWGSYRLEAHHEVFAIIASLYPGRIVQEDYVGYYHFNLNEGMILQYLAWKYPGSYSAILKNGDGTPIIDHIGDYFHGKRICPNEPNWEIFNYDRFDPTKKYCSKTGYLMDDPNRPVV